MLTSITAAAPIGVRLYVRVVASNAVGSALSNEISFVVSPPSAPSAPTLAAPVVSGRNVTLNWTPSPGATGYVVLARLPGNPTVIASLPIGATSVTVPGVPPGTYVVTVAATNQYGGSAESNQVVVTVR
jgi:hypothetical protein